MKQQPNKNCMVSALFMVLHDKDLWITLIYGFNTFQKPSSMAGASGSKSIVTGA